MLRMCTACQKSDLYIRKRRTCQHTEMLFFLQMCKDQTLPVSRKHVLTACSKKLTPASRLSRLYQKMNLRIMTERFKVTHTFYRFRDCFLVDYAARTKLYRCIKPIPDQLLKDFYLYFSHQLRMDFSQLAVPEDMKFRLFLLKLPKLLKHLMRITVRRKLDLIIQDRLQNRKFRLAFYSKSLARIGSAKSCYRADGSRICLCDRCVFCP